MPKSKSEKPSAAARKEKTDVSKSASKPAATTKKEPEYREFDGPRVSLLSNPDDVIAKLNLSPFLKRQYEKLLILRDSMLDSMHGVAEGNLRSRAEGSEASAFGQHQADAGSDAYDRDFALSLLSQEQDALYEIQEALKRIEAGNYGNCEMSQKPIPHARLEAIPFARYTVECQSQIEKQGKSVRVRQSVTSLFGLSDEDGDGEEEESSLDSKE